MSKHRRRKTGGSQSYSRFGLIPVEVVVEAMNKGEVFLKYEDLPKVNITSTRIRTYTKGTTCVHCKKEAHYFAVEVQRGSGATPHLNLYHKKEDGSEVMITSDHIKAKSLGGDNASLDNRQPLCLPCNVVKGKYGSVDEGRAAMNTSRQKKESKSLEMKVDWLKANILHLLEMQYRFPTQNYGETLKRRSHELLRLIRRHGYETL